MNEVPDAFHVRKVDGYYSVLHSYDVINKADIFCIVGAAGELKYPESFEAAPAFAAVPIDSFGPSAFQAALLKQQIEAQKQQTSALRDIGTIGIISVLAAVSTSIALWSMYGLMK